MSNAHGLYDLRRLFITYITWKNLLLLGAIILIAVHVTRYFKTPDGLVVVSIGVEFVRITNKNTLNSSRYEFTKLFFLVLDEALPTKDTEI
jgi:hypothetical protein